MNQSFSLLPNDELKELNQKLDKILSFIQNNPKGTTTEIIGGKWVSEKEAQRIHWEKGNNLMENADFGRVKLYKT